MSKSQSYRYWASIFNLWLAQMILVQSVFSEHRVISTSGELMRISVVKSIADMDLAASKKILVDSFMHAYENVPLTELNPEFKSTGDVRRFYEQYFEEELNHFKHGEVIWVQAFADEKLAGWGTFELEPNQHDAAYMNLLVVAPEYQQKGIGKLLVFSICSEELYPHITTLNLLIRKVNIGGSAFYHKLGFVDSDYTRGNFVDPKLLTGLTFHVREKSIVPAKTVELFSSEMITKE